jgi:hypothetical protein
MVHFLMHRMREENFSHTFTVIIWFELLKGKLTKEWGVLYDWVSMEL